MKYSDGDYGGGRNIAATLTAVEEIRRRSKREERRGDERKNPLSINVKKRKSNF